MAVVILKGAGQHIPDPLVQAGDNPLFEDDEQINFVRALARQHARLDHEQALDRKAH